MTSKLQLPCIHLNGTSIDEILSQLSEAGSAVGAAVRALDKAAPHKRDYYPLGEEAWKRATDEHKARVERLTSVYQELFNLIQEIDKLG